MANKKSIISILKHSNKLTLEELKEVLELNNNTEVYQLLLKTLDNGLKNIDRNDTSKRYQYLYKIFSFFDMPPKDVSLEKLKTSLNNIKEKYEHNLELKIQRGEKVPLSKLTTRLLNNIDDTVIKINSYQDTSQVAISEDITYKFMEYLIFVEKNYLYVYELTKNFPHILNIKNRDEKTLIESLINHYIDAVISNNQHYYIIYYGKLINLFLSAPQFSIKKQKRKDLVGKLISAIHNNKNYEENEEENRITFYLNEVLSLLKDFHSKNTIDEINFKYSTNPIIEYNMLSEIYTIKTNSSDYLDCRNKRIITIDNTGTTIFDDACSLEKMPNGNYLLGVYVSDLTSYISKYSKTVEEAYKNAHTIYLPDKVITMFPESVNKLVSLTSKRDKFAFGYFFELTKELECVDFKVKRTIINVDMNLSHNDVDDNLNKAKDIDIYILLKNMLEISEHMRDKSVNRTQYRTIKKIKRNIISEQTLDLSTDLSVGSMIITEFMILVNNYVADYFNSKQIPFIYRVNQSSEDSDALNYLKSEENKCQPLDEIIKYLKTLYTPSYYSTDNIGHSGLNLQSYSHVTNPIRKFSSFTTEYLISKFMISETKLSPKRKIELEQYLKELCDHLNEREKISEEFKEEYCKIYFKNK